MSSLSQRIIVGVIGIPVFVAIILLGGYFIFAAALILSLFCIYEYNLIAEKKLAAPLSFLTYILDAVFLIGIKVCLTPSHSGNFTAFCLAAAVASVLLVFTLNLWNRSGGTIANISAGLVPLGYITLSFASLIIISEFDIFVRFVLNVNGTEPNMIASAGWNYLILGIFVAIWASDTFAYFVGRAVGRHKLFERISPKKTWEGAAAGFLGAIVGFFLVLHFSGYFENFSAFSTILNGAVIGIAGIFGDLAESQLKRDAEIKDSSHLIPGHGGVLDRFDSAIFAFPAVLFILLMHALC